MEFRKAAVNFFLKPILNTLCQIDCAEFVHALSINKPSLVIINHVNFLEVPILVSHSYPINVTGLAKAETWKNPFFAFLFNTYHGIPINRNGAFKEPFKQVKQAIENGYYVCVAPEGKRSKDGVLGKGKGGIIQLALEANVPILPVAHYGGEKFWQNFRCFRRTPFYLKAGRAFKIKFNGRPGREEREDILTEIMKQIAVLLPLEKRGIYSQQTEIQPKHLEIL